MNLHEYQAKQLLQKYGVPTPPFILIGRLEELDAALDTLGTDQVVLKVQIHAGGRGKAGGVKLAKNRQEAHQIARSLLGMRIVNAQTGKEGVVADKLLISPLISYEKEYYLAVTIDRKKATAVLIASPEGGTEIEEIAQDKPEALLHCPIPLDGKMRAYQLLEVAKFMGWTGKSREAGMKLVNNLTKAFVELDCSLIEINPLVLKQDETLAALDAKLSVDDNALFRHHELAKQFDRNQISLLEATAQQHELAYIALDGEIGCMVNGAGLAMATMDVIEFYGGKPANFLDVGGGATEDKVAAGFKIILSDPKVKAILVNIFGGIMSCETLASGIIVAAKEVGIKVPLIVRLEGTNVERGKALLAQSGLKIQIADSLAEAAQASVKAVKNGYSS